jgi:CRISPR/Cas system CSM-associated protein Csm3 (group 7 of RAMP superfamily)
MLMQSVNELFIRLMLTSVSPLLVKEGRVTEDRRKDWSGDKKEIKIRMPHAIPVSRATEAEIFKALTNPDPLAAAGRLPFYIPGTSLRGAWRAHLERSLRSLDSPDNAKVCDPLDDEGEVYRSCSAVLTGEKEYRDFVPYTLSCPVCRLFGNTTQGARLSITDGELGNPSPNLLVSREHVRIDRKEGRVAQGALIKQFGLQGAKFQLEIRLRNFELPHVRLIGALLKDVRIGAVPLGSGKNKGYGQVKGEFEEIRFTAYGLNKPDDRLRGVAEHPDPAMAQWFQRRYELTAAETLTELPPGEWIAAIPWRFERTMTTDQFEALWPQLPLPWSDVKPLAARVARVQA